MKETVSRSVVSDSVTPRTIVLQPPSVHGILQARIPELVAILFSPEDLPDPGVKPRSSTLSHQGLELFSKKLFPKLHCEGIAQLGEH